MATKELRYYQKEAIAETINWWDNIGPRALCSMYPGSGKTFMGVKLVRQIRTTINPRPRVIWMAHRQELITQPKRAFIEEFTPEIVAREMKVGLIGGVDGKTFRDYKSDVYCASIQSLIYRGAPSEHLKAILSNGKIDYLVIDETHHVVADTYLMLLDTLTGDNPNLKVLGITGTHDRTDRVSLGNVFQDVVEEDRFTYYYSYEQARKDRVSAPIDPYVLETNLDIGKFRVGDKGEISQARYDELWEAGNWGDLMVDGLKEKGFPEQNVLAFMPSVKVSASFIKFLGERHEIEGAHIGESGAFRWSNHRQEMVPIKRSEMWKLYERGDIPIVSNFNVATEGFDSPKTKLGLLCRRTKSVGTYTQMAARYTRPYPGPYVNGEMATLLHVGFEGHAFVDSSCLGGDMIPKEIKELEKLLEGITLTTNTLKKLCTKCGDEVVPHPEEAGSMWCPHCLLVWSSPDKEELYFDIADPSKPSGKGIHFRPIKLIAEAEVAWTQEDGILSVSIGTAGNGRVPEELAGLDGDRAEFAVNSNEFRCHDFLRGKAERVLIIASPGKCPRVGDQYALIGVYKTVKSSEWKGGRFNKFQVHEYYPQEYAILSMGNDLEQMVEEANKIIHYYKEPILADKDKGWRGKPASDKQIAALRSLGFNPAGLTKGQASSIQSFKYAQMFLRRRGVID